MSKIKNGLRKVIYKMIALCARRKSIVFESAPDFSDNTRPVFDEILRRGLDRKYNLVWSVSGDKKLPIENPHIRYIVPNPTKFRERVCNNYYLASAKCLICCNRFLIPESSQQTAFYLSHGTPMKNIRTYYYLPEGIDYCLAAGPGVAELVAYQFRVDETKVFPLGFPRNDILTQAPRDIKSMLGTQCDKVIVWYPTFRQHKSGRIAGSGEALPIIHNVEFAKQLNKVACDENVLIVLKPHFGQDVQSIKDAGLSNIRFIDESFFEKHDISSYAFVGSSDALITDYSSIYFDYTLCDKPIALIWEDLEEYRENPGFAIDLEAHTKCAEIVYTLRQLEDFVRNVGSAIDIHREIRREYCKQVNYSNDGKNTQRVVDFIIEKANL